MSAPSLNEDFMIVGAHAMAVHGVPRATGDLYILVRPEPDNAKRVLGALQRFGAPLAQHGITEAAFVQPGSVYQLGLPPRRIDLLTAISGVSFEEAWNTRTRAQLQGREVCVLGRDCLLRNKRATGRPKKLADVRLLEKP